MLKEFKEFAMRGNVLDMAVGIIIGAAFGKIVSSLVDDMIMPPIGRALGHVDFSNLFMNLGETPYATIAEAKAHGAATLNYGLFLNTIVNFLDYTIPYAHHHVSHIFYFANGSYCQLIFRPGELIKLYNKSVI